VGVFWLSPERVCQEFLVARKFFLGKGT